MATARYHLSLSPSYFYCIKETCDVTTNISPEIFVISRFFKLNKYLKAYFLLKNVEMILQENNLPHDISMRENMTNSPVYKNRNFQHMCRQCQKIPWFTEAVVQRYSIKKVFLEISQNLQENTCARVPFLIKNIFWCKCFPVIFVKFLRTPFL